MVNTITKPEKQVQAPEAINVDEKKLVSKVKKSGLITILTGVGLIVIGIVITLVSYNMAKEGAKYIFAWGPMVFGVLAIFRGLFTVLSPYRSLHKRYDTPTQKHVFKNEKPHQSLQAVAIIVVSAIVLSIAISLLSGKSNTDSNDGTSNLNANSSSLKATYDSCNSELDTITKDLNATEARMKTYQDSGDTDSYNSLIDQQNEQVQKYNAKYDECDADFDAYNKSFTN